jgi:transcriptional regulator
MYEPEHFRVTDRATLIDIIRARPLGLLVVAGGADATADAIPFLIDASGPALRLRAHVARANPVWRRLRESAGVLVVFQAEDHDISPAWYATKQETGRVVPTWNYVMVQARGRASVHDDADWTRALVEAQTRSQEKSRAQPWEVADAPEAFIAAQLRGIVGFEIEVDEIKGKFKLSQNRNERDRNGVVEGLRAAPAGVAMAARMSNADEAGS